MRLVALASMVVLALTIGALAADRADVSPLFEGGARRLNIGAMPAGMSNGSACAQCHAEIAAEWRSSLHAAAWTDPVFQAAYVREPLAFCRNCHAPLHEGDRPTGVAARDGVSCVVCHVRDGQVLGTRGVPAPHPVKLVAALDTSAFCGSCHEFGFHTGELETAELQQSTLSEWHARVGDGRTNATCQSCHMPSVAGGTPHRAHGFTVQRDVASIANAVHVAVALRRDGERTLLDATLLPGTIGHAFPTGDLYRRLELRAWLEGDPSKTAKLVYARGFGDRPLPPEELAKLPSSNGPSLTTERFETSDTRVGEDPATTRTLDLTHLGPDARRVRWRLDYMLMPAEIARENKVSPETNIRLLHEGSLTLP